MKIFSVLKNIILSGNLYVKRLGNFYKPNSDVWADISSARPTDANIPSDNSGGVRKFLATTSMTSNKPPIGDAHILNLDWDNGDRWSAQLAVGNDGGGIAYRGLVDNGWTTWVKAWDEKNAKNINYIGTYTHVSGTMRTKRWAHATETTTWTAPRKGFYLVTMSIFPQTDQQGADMYKQFRATGTATIINVEGNGLYVLGGSKVVGTQWSFPVYAEQGQTVSSTMWTDTADIIYNINITGVYLGIGN